MEEDKILVTFSMRERDIIRNETFYDPDFGKVCIVDGNKIHIGMTLDEIEDVMGYAAAEANHTKNKKLQKELDKIVDRLQEILNEYD